MSDLARSARFSVLASASANVSTRAEAARKHAEAGLGAKGRCPPAVAGGKQQQFRIHKGTLRSVYHGICIELMADEKISVHDNVVLSYEVNCSEQRIVLRTRFEERKPFEYTDIVFEGVCAYRFQDDWLANGNILFDVERVELKDLVEKYQTELLDGWRYGWPPVGRFETIPELMERLEAREVSAFEIAPTCGLCGFVMARTMRFVPSDVR